jgi:adenylate cyclase
MPTQAELIKGVEAFFDVKYVVTEGYAIPNVQDIPLENNTGRELELAMLFIDIRESTQIVDNLRRETAAKMYKAFLWGVAKIARMNDGELRSFNGDGLLVAFVGDTKETNAAKAARQMAWFGQKVLKPRLDSVFQGNFSLRKKRINFDFGIGVDVGKVLVVRGGIRGDNNNDLVWVGNATNFAVHLSQKAGLPFNALITEGVYKGLSDKDKYESERFFKKKIWYPVSNDDKIKYYKCTSPLEIV